MKTIDKINRIAKDNSKWKEKALKSRENRPWQKHAQKIAVKVLRAMRSQKMKQKELAEKIGVSPQQISKIVKAQENLTLQSIAKLEEALQIDLLFIEIEKKQIVHHEIIKEKPVYFTVSQPKEVSKETMVYNPKQTDYLEILPNEKKAS